MSTDTEFPKNIETLKQAIKEAKRLEKEFADRIDEMNATIKKIEGGRRKTPKRTG